MTTWQTALLRRCWQRSNRCERRFVRIFAPTRRALTCEWCKLYEAQLDRAMAEHRTRVAVSAQYENKIIEVERYYRDRLRAQADEAEKLQNAKLDIIAGASALTACSSPDRSVRTANESVVTYDDSSDDDDHDGGDGDKSANDSRSREEVEQILLSEPRSVLSSSSFGDAGSEVRRSLS